MARFSVGKCVAQQYIRCGGVSESKAQWSLLGVFLELRRLTVDWISAKKGSIQRVVNLFISVVVILISAFRIIIRVRCDSYEQSSTSALTGCHKTHSTWLQFIARVEKDVQEWWWLVSCFVSVSNIVLIQLWTSLPRNEPLEMLWMEEKSNHREYRVGLERIVYNRSFTNSLCLLLWLFIGSCYAREESAEIGICRYPDLWQAVQYIVYNFDY